MNAIKLMNDSKAMRWLMLVLVSGLMFSTYYFYDFFAPLRGLLESEHGITSDEFGKILFFMTLPNILGMIIIGGIIIDKFGVRFAGLLFGGITVLGGIVSAMTTAGFFGTDKSSILTGLIIGRLLFGIGIEATLVVVTRAIVKWFKGHELALAMAISVGIGRLGTALALAITLDISSTSIAPSVVFGAATLVASFLMFVVYLFFDVKFDRQLKEKKISMGDDQPDEDFKFKDLVKLISTKAFIFIALLCVAFYASVFPFIQYAPDLLVNKFGFSYNLPEGAAIYLFGSESLGSVVVFVVIFLFALGFTLLPDFFKEKRSKIFSVVLLLAVFAFLVSQIWDVLSIWFINGPKAASLIPLGSVVFTPIFGKYVDTNGKAASLMIIGSFLLIFANIALSLFSSTLLAYLGLLSLGVAFSLVPAAMWPAVAKIVPDNRLGTAYASMFTLQNWGLGAFFFGIGWLLSKMNPIVESTIAQTREVLAAEGLTGGEISARISELQVAGEIPFYDYTWPMLMLVACGVFSILLAYLLKKEDREKGYGLELPSNG